MNKIKILILGSAGMAGHVIKSHLSLYNENLEVYDVARSELYVSPSYLLDVTNFNELRNLITNLKPDFLINCVGILNKSAEENPDLAILVNSYLPHLLEKETKNTKCKIIHISTDCVFSGAKGGYIESDLKDGVGFYSQSKALGEVINNKDLTIRTSIIGPELNSTGIGLLHWFLNQKNDISGYSKAYWSGVTTLELAKFIYNVITVDHELNGVFHLTNNLKIDKYSLLKLFQNIFKLNTFEVNSNDKYKIDKSLINTCAKKVFVVSDYETMIHEMRNFILDNKSWYQYQISE